jgi:hypothetical protein
MMHKFGVIALALGLAAAPTAFADQGKEPVKKPMPFADQGKEPVKKPMPKAVKMTDAQLDNVVAGDLIDATVNSTLLDVNTNNVVHINNVARINKVDVF